MSLPKNCSKCKKAFPKAKDGSVGRYYSNIGWVCLKCKTPMWAARELEINKLEPRKVVP